MTFDLALHRELLTAGFAAISVFLALMAVLWPYLQRNQLATRISAIAGGGEGSPARAFAGLHGGGTQPLLRSEPKRLFQAIVDRLNLAKEAEDGEIARKLRMAGYRGKAPVIAFLAARALGPVLMLVAAVIYVFVVLQLDRPIFVKLGICVAAAYVGYYAPAVFLKNKILKRQKSIRRAWPDALDLLLICVESGMSVETAFRKVSDEIGMQSAELAEELRLTTAELSYLQSRREAYENLGERTGLEPVRNVVTSLIQAEKYGTPVGQSLRVLAKETRDARMSEAEKKAAALPPKLTVPMILFFLPVLFAVILTPAAIQIMKLQ